MRTKINSLLFCSCANSLASQDGPDLVDRLHQFLSNFRNLCQKLALNIFFARRKNENNGKTSGAHTHTHTWTCCRLGVGARICESKDKDSLKERVNKTWNCTNITPEVDVVVVPWRSRYCCCCWALDAVWNILAVWLEINLGFKKVHFVHIITIDIRAI